MSEASRRRKYFVLVGVGVVVVAVVAWAPDSALDSPAVVLVLDEGESDLPGMELAVPVAGARESENKL